MDENKLSEMQNAGEDITFDPNNEETKLNHVAFTEKDKTELSSLNLESIVLSENDYTKSNEINLDTSPKNGRAV